MQSGQNIVSKFAYLLRNRVYHTPNPAVEKWRNLGMSWILILDTTQTCEYVGFGETEGWGVVDKEMDRRGCGTVIRIQQ